MDNSNDETPQDQATKAPAEEQQPSNATPPAPEGADPNSKPTKVELGVNWEANMVVLTATTEGQPNIQLQIPVDTFVQAGVTIGMQLLNRLQGMQATRSPIRIAQPGELGGLKLH